MQLVEKHKIKRTHRNYGEIDELSFAAKNLYNAANYIVRQEFIRTSKEKEEGLRENANWIRYHQLNSMLMNDENYVHLPRKVSQQILMMLDRNWKGFFRSIKEWKKNPDKFSGKPSLPKYKHKTKGRGCLIYTNQAISNPVLKEGFIKPSGTNIKIPYMNKEYPPKQVRIIPKVDSYVMEVIYEKPNEDLQLNKNRTASVDLGVNNLMTITTDQPGFRPVLIKGGPVKSINQYYNKKLAEMKGELPEDVYTSKGIKKLTEKRNNKICHWMHIFSKMFVDLCINNDLGRVVIGYNEGWKDESNMGKKSNQNFVQIPFSKLTHMIQYKCEQVGIEVIFQEESYTSKANFLNMDNIPVYPNKLKNEPEFTGYREKRGMYKVKGKKLRVNADVNGSYNILRKAIPNAFADGIEGVVVRPLRWQLPSINC